MRGGSLKITAQLLLPKARASALYNAVKEEMDLFATAFIIAHLRVYMEWDLLML